MNDPTNNVDAASYSAIARWHLAASGPCTAASVAYAIKKHCTAQHANEYTHADAAHLLSIMPDVRRWSDAEWCYELCPAAAIAETNRAAAAFAADEDEEADRGLDGVNEAW